MNRAHTSSNASNSDGSTDSISTSSATVSNAINPADTTNRTTDIENPTQGGSVPSSKLTGSQKGTIALYIFLRLVVFLILMAIIQGIAVLLGIGDIFPWAASALLGFFISVPLSLLTMANLRTKVSEYIAIANTASRAHKRRMQEELEQAL